MFICTKRKKGHVMTTDPKLVNQFLSTVSYPIDTANLIKFARQRGANDQILRVFERLPQKTFNSQQDLQDAMRGLGISGETSKR